MLLFLKFFYLESKSDDFIDSNNVIIRSIEENIIEEKLSFSALNIRNRLGFCDNIIRLLHSSLDTLAEIVFLRARYWERVFNYDIIVTIIGLLTVKR